MQTVIFDKNDYKSYQDFYKDASKKLGNINTEDYYDTSTFDFDPDILLEYLLLGHGYINDPITIILRNFDLEKIKKQKTYDDYEWSLIFKVMQRFTQDYPNNKLIIE